MFPEFPEFPEWMCLDVFGSIDADVRRLKFILADYSDILAKENEFLNVYDAV
jgi:hypothetical protein